MKKSTCIVLGLCLCLLGAAHLFAEEGSKVQIASAAPSAGHLPGVRVLGSISDKYKPVTFDHPKHVMIADSCATCHHQHADTKKLDCKDCHALDPSVFKKSVKNNFIACSNCHGAYDRENPSLPGLKVAYHRQCFQCHRGMGNVGLDPKGCTELCHAKKPEKLSAKAGK